MPNQPPTDATAASWAQLEHVVERLHAAARSQVALREFYRRLIAEAASAVGAVGGAAWRVADEGRLEPICEVGAGELAISARQVTARREAVVRAAAAREAVLESAVETTSKRGKGESGLSAYELLICPVPQPGAVEDPNGRAPAVAAFELWIPTGAGPMVHQGWLELAATIAEIASDFHALEELRRLREGASLHRQAVEILRRVGRPRDLRGAAYEVANEGRRALGCDRLSVVVRRGGRWRLLSVSGATRVQRRHELSQRMERLADQLARWGEPIEYPPHASAASDLPPRLSKAIEEHVDHGQARELACAPISFATYASGDSEAKPTRRRRTKFDAVLIAEQFDGEGGGAWRPQLVEFADLCGPALARAAALDKFPMRTLVRWSERLDILRRPARALRALLIAGIIAGAVAALIYVPADFDVEAPARLQTAVHRDVFATATGAVAELHAKHGQQVATGDVLAVIHDPELSLKLQQVRGEIDAIQKRLDALAVTRTDRTLREEASDDRLPLAAEQRQLEEQLASLDLQRKLLDARRTDLTIRSPIAGQILTRDVDALLQSRPVERGQVMLTIADTSSGWEVVADVPQRHIGHVLAAQHEQSGDVAASLRLAGDIERSYSGRLVEVSASTPLEAAGLEEESPPVEVRIAVEGDAPPAARPGMAASVRIHCGQRSLGYVWLHDVAATVYRWVTF